MALSPRRLFSYATILIASVIVVDAMIAFVVYWEMFR